MYFMHWAFHFMKYKECWNDSVAIVYNGGKFKLFRCYAREWFYITTFEKGKNAFARFLELSDQRLTYYEARRLRNKPQTLNLKEKFTEKDKLTLSIIENDPVAMDILEDVLARGI